MKIEIPENVREIIKKLNDAGYEAYAVGGCIRDMLLGRIPQDWDITTNAHPEEVKQLFRRTVDTGIQHGTVTVMVDDEGYEVTTYRIDGDYKDSRHPDSVTFTPSLEEDLKRRDFTVNAMAYNEEEGLVDLFSGREDLNHRIIRAVGDPRARFSEDALRIMRCIRFSAQLDFLPEEKTFAAAKELSWKLESISEERIRDELMKTLMSDHPEKVLEFEETGAMKYIFPRFSEKREVRIQKLLHTEKDRILRLSAFLYGLDAKDAAEVLKMLRFDNDTVNRVFRLLQFSEREIPSDDAGIRHLMADFGLQDIFRLVAFTGKAEVIPKAEEILGRGDCVSLKDLDISGDDLIKNGMKPGKELGEMLRYLLEIVLDNPEMNRKDILLKQAQLTKDN